MSDNRYLNMTISLDPILLDRLIDVSMATGLSVQDIIYSTLVATVFDFSADDFIKFREEC